LKPGPGRKTDPLYRVAEQFWHRNPSKSPREILNLIRVEIRKDEASRLEFLREEDMEKIAGTGPENFKREFLKKRREWRERHDLFMESSGLRSAP